MIKYALLVATNNRWSDGADRILTTAGTWSVQMFNVWPESVFTFIWNIHLHNLARRGEVKDTAGGRMFFSGLY